MNVLIAEDDPISRRLLKINLLKWGYEVVETCDGAQAWEELSKENPPPIAILDWMMPKIDGVDLCRRIRETDTSRPTYVILLTAKTSNADIVAGLQEGADDYVKKPFDPAELRARVGVGTRVVTLQAALADRVRQLARALAQVNQLHGLLPICMYCKRVRDDADYWHQIERFVAEHSNATFTHGICPPCYEKVSTEAGRERLENATPGDLSRGYRNG